MNGAVHTDVELTDAIFHRRSIRQYDDRRVDPDTVRRLLSAAAQAPSAMNQQPWVFAVFHGHERLRDYSLRAKLHLIHTYPVTFEPHPRVDLYERPDYDIFHGADTLIVIYATGGPLNPNEDCCLAAQNLMLAAYGLGLGSCPIGFARPWLDLAETKRELDVPEHYHAVFPLVIGYPAGAAEAPRHDEPNIVSWKWDGP